MYMERIEVPVLHKAKSKPKSLKLAVGLLFVLVSFALMVPWTIASFVWLGVAAIARLAAKTVTTVHETLLYAGEAVVGR